ncbi:hypothetical protein BGZ99_001578, partial [Dissophora globulifera]
PAPAVGLPTVSEHADEAFDDFIPKGKNPMVLFRRSRPAQDALVLANANIEIARNTLDKNYALKCCKAAEKELEKINVSESVAYLDQIIAAYRAHGGALEKLGSRDKAKRSYNKAYEL